MNRAEMLQRLRKRGLRPIHDRSQNFLLDESVVERIVAGSGVAAGEAVLEIGAGPGILTAALLDAGAVVTAVELDARLCELQRDAFADRPNYRLVEGDALTLPLDQLVVPGTPDGGYRLVANLPYAITSPLLTRFLSAVPRPHSLTVMVQREVADRIMAKPGKMSSLAVFVQTLAEVSLVARVPRGAFLPPPKVDSSVIHIRLYDADKMAEFFGDFTLERFFQMVRCGFAERRKQLKNSLRQVVNDPTELENWLNSAKISPTCRPEQLTVGDWQRLAQHLPN